MPNSSSAEQPTLLRPNSIVHNKMLKVSVFHPGLLTGAFSIVAATVVSLVRAAFRNRYSG